MRWSLTGAAAAYQLQHYYKAPEIPLFIETVTDKVSRRLRLLPDKNGPITLLRPLGAAFLEGNLRDNRRPSLADLRRADALT